MITLILEWIIELILQYIKNSDIKAFYVYISINFVVPNNPTPRNKGSLCTNNKIPEPLSRSGDFIIHLRITSTSLN